MNIPEFYHAVQMCRAKDDKYMRFYTELARKQTFYLFPGSVSDFDGDLSRFWPLPWDASVIEEKKLKQKEQKQWTDSNIANVLRIWEEQLKKKA